MFDFGLLHCSSLQTDTVDPRHNEPQLNEIREVMHFFLFPTLCAIEAHVFLLQFNRVILDCTSGLTKFSRIADTYQKPTSARR